MNVLETRRAFYSCLKKKKKKSAVAPDQPQTHQVQGALIRRPVTKKHALYAHLEDRGTAAGKRFISKSSFCTPLTKTSLWCKLNKTSVCKWFKDVKYKCEDASLYEDCGVFLSTAIHTDRQPEAMYFHHLLICQ